MNLLTNVVPILLYFAGYLYLKKPRINKKAILKYRFTLLFFLFLTVSFIINISTSYDLITKRYLPFAFFVGFLLFFNRPEDFNVNGMFGFLRATFVASIILYFGPDYLSKTQSLMESDTIFGVSSGPRSFSLVYHSFVRNVSFTWDHRIVAVIAYLYALLSLLYKPRYFRLDLLLSLVIVITSTSRGGMITYALILAAYLFQVYRKQFTKGLLIAVPVVALIFFFINIHPPERLSGFLNSFNPGAKDNAMTQREFFSDYAVDAYQKKPIFGNGVGFLSSKLIDRHLVVDGSKVPAIGDAYWYVLLAEMGLVGLLLYVLFLMEVFYSSGILNIALLLGFSIQLLGTDIPDIRFFYFAVLVLVYLANERLTGNLVKTRSLLNEN